MSGSLHRSLDDTVRRSPDHLAIEDPLGGQITYTGLGELSDRLRDRLRRMGVRPGDRVGLCLRKSIDAVATIYGILKTGGAYVPADPAAPPRRNAWIFKDCRVAAIVADRALFSDLERELGDADCLPPSLLLEGPGASRAPSPLAAALDEAESLDPAPAAPSHRSAPEDLAYLLYTSGSTGTPKGVMLTHGNAESFLGWCAEAFAPAPEDRLSSHAPLHFDLSILDVHLALRRGATLVLIPEEIGRDPFRLAALIAERRITLWYSAPSILALLPRHGRLEEHDYSALRQVLFAGEVFPIGKFRELRRRLPAPRYCNLYGPTETNVCTWYEVPPPPAELGEEPLPIGRACSHVATRVAKEDGAAVEPGEEGDLWVSGPPITPGYWNLPGRNAEVFREDGDGRLWYRTGDIVRENAAGDYVFLGRRDRMVKKRGYRIELGEIEAALHRHPAIAEAGVIALPDEEAGLRVVAFLSAGDAPSRPSIIALKTFCAENLPVYMVPDRFCFLEALPRTSTDKVDYVALSESLSPSA